MPKKKLKLRKNDFIDALSHMSPDDINKFILEKGKDPKPFWPVFFYRSGKNAHFIHGDK